MHNHKPTLKSIFFPILNKAKPSENIYKCKVCGEKIMVKKNHGRVYNIIGCVVNYIIPVLPIVVISYIKIVDASIINAKCLFLILCIWLFVFLSAHIILNMCVPFEVCRDDEEKKMDSQE